jgi:hypothetical protein
MEKTIVAFIASSFADSISVNLIEEYRYIYTSIRKSINSDKISLLSIRFNQWEKLLINLVNPNPFVYHEPKILHFCGHENIKQQYMFLKYELNSILLSENCNIKLTDLSNRNVQLVILNGCKTNLVAERISKEINYCIGFENEIDKNDAIDFSTSFYSSLASGKSIEESFEKYRFLVSNKKVKPILFRK